MRLRVLSVLLVAACSATSTSSINPPPSAPRVATIDVLPSSVAILVGNTVQLADTIRNALGEPFSGTLVTWASSDPAVATVSTSGSVTGVAPGGPVTITATSEGVSGHANVIVAPKPTAAKLTLSPATAVIEVNATLSIAVLRDGVPITPGSDASWSSNNYGVADMQILGVVRAKSPGTAQIGITTGGLGATATITVVPMTTVPTLRVIPATVSVPIGSTAQLAVTDGSGAPIPGVAVSWKSRTPSIASVDPATGVVTTVGPGGPIVIVATATVGSNVLTAEANVTVSQPLTAPVAYALADQPTTAAYAPDAAWQFNSIGTPLTVTRLSDGLYNVTIPGFGGSGTEPRIPFVSAVGDVGVNCVAAGWSMVGVIDATVQVKCVAPGGVPADSRFTVFALGPDHVPGHLLVLANSGAPSTWPVPLFTDFPLTGASAWSSRGSYLGLSRNAPSGNTSVLFNQSGPVSFDPAIPGSYDGAIVQPSGTPNAMCQLIANGTNFVQSVCYAAGAGAVADAAVSALVIRDGRLNKRFGVSHPVVISSSGGDVFESRTGTGRFRVRFVGLGRPAGSRETVLVSAVSPDILNAPSNANATTRAAFCGPSAPWTTIGNDLVIDIACYNAAGVLTDSPGVVVIVIE